MTRAIHSARLRSAMARTVRQLCLLLATLSVGCGAQTMPSPTAPPTMPPVTITGTVVDRVNGGVVSGSTVLLDSGSATLTTTVANGTFQFASVPLGIYRVVISSPAHVTHTTLSMVIDQSAALQFSVIPWGAARFGATYDDTFDKFFHQLARVSDSLPSTLRKWTIMPRQIYVVSGAVPADSLDLLLSALGDVNRDTIPALFCNQVGALPITTGPDVAGPSNGQILIRPAVTGGSSGSLGGSQSGTSGLVTLGLSGSFGGPHTRGELVGILAHEIFHVAGAFHVCGGDVGTNPFGFSRTNCPYPDSLMANLGDLPQQASAQDRLAACLMYHPHTVRGNLAPDTNPTYR